MFPETEQVQHTECFPCTINFKCCIVSLQYWADSIQVQVEQSDSAVKHKTPNFLLSSLIAPTSGQQPAVEFWAKKQQSHAQCIEPNRAVIHVVNTRRFDLRLNGNKTRQVWNAYFKYDKHKYHINLGYFKLGVTPSLKSVHSI